jgi:hypothetical protein
MMFTPKPFRGIPSSLPFCTNGPPSIFLPSDPTPFSIRWTYRLVF